MDPANVLVPLDGSRKRSSSSSSDNPAKRRAIEISNVIEEMVKSTIITTFYYHKYLQTSFGISKGFDLTHKLLKVVFSNLDVDI